jgi:hypothetical protein
MHDDSTIILTIISLTSRGEVIIQNPGNYSYCILIHRSCVYLTHIEHMDTYGGFFSHGVSPSHNGCRYRNVLMTWMTWGTLHDFGTPSTLRWGPPVKKFINPSNYYIVTTWLVVYLPLWKIWNSVGMIIPSIWKNKKCIKPPASNYYYKPHLS